MFKPSSRVQVAQDSGHHDIAQMIDATAFAVSPLMAMPWEVLIHVLSFLDPFDLCVAAQVCSVRSIGGCRVGGVAIHTPTVHPTHPPTGVGPIQSMNELTSDDALWRRFCGDTTSCGDQGTTSGDEGADGGHVWKPWYMQWLRPNLRQYALNRGTHLVCHLAVSCRLTD